MSPKKIRVSSTGNFEKTLINQITCSRREESHNKMPFYQVEIGCCGLMLMCIPDGLQQQGGYMGGAPNMGGRQMNQVCAH